jgi:hypothetical protein
MLWSLRRPRWVRGDCHTQTIDGFWSLLKRGLIGSFHRVSIKHLGKYIAEFQFRFNRREDEEIFAAVVLGLVTKEALRYKALTSPKNAAPAPPASEWDSDDDPDSPF